ncbi:acetate--CoA ligase [Halomicroarcula sp. F13]|uniref:Acetate--CoA ligase n=1 Tax=Haloarcula rubra TaxID=2487747 RepID=A0AAW4PVZ0_9EURY|nr:acetate--CoA ligase [Halomicroarcula rubra]MBX0324432.1 acetate--CoA ligase [Halomicroarcula rubra]
MTTDNSTVDLVTPQLRALLREGEESPETLWARVADDLHWFEPWDAVYEEDGVADFAWFSGGRTNMSYNAVDYHVENGGGNRAAMVFETGERGGNEVYTYSELRHEVEQVAGMLRAYGVEKGDRVTIYMPMSPEAVVSMLACTRIGAIHSVVFGGFGAGALADRIELAEPKLLLTADVGFREGGTVDLKSIVDRCFDDHESVHDIVDDTIVLSRGDEETTLRDYETDWDDALAAGADEDTSHVEMDATDPAFILPTSGTTGKPKGTVHQHGGYQTHVYAMAKWMFDLDETDTWFATSDIGWIVGHSYIVYAPLLTGSTTVVYEGTPTYPDAGIWWDLVERHGVDKIFTAPTAIRALAGYDDEFHERADLSSLEAIFSAGEPLNPPAWEWLQQEVLDDEVPVIDHMWQTETGGPIIGNPYGINTLPIKPGSAGIALPGIEVDVVDFDGEPLEPGEEGALVVEKPFPGMTPTLWEGHDRYELEYWQQIEDLYWVGDAVSMDEDGYLWFSGRADEVITIAGHRIGPTDIEDALVAHEAVVEAAVVGKPDPEKTEVAAAFVVLRDSYDGDEALADELRTAVREDVGPIAIVGELEFVDQLPKTRSGKIMRRTIRDIMLDEDLGDVSTMEDESAVDEIEAATEDIDADADVGN